MLVTYCYYCYYFIVYIRDRKITIKTDKSEYKVRLGNDPRNRIILLDPHSGKSKANEKLGAIEGKN